MARNIHITLPDEMERRIRDHIMRKYGGRERAFSFIIQQAVMEFLDKEEGKE